MTFSRPTHDLQETYKNSQNEDILNFVMKFSAVQTILVAFGIVGIAMSAGSIYFFQKEITALKQSKVNLQPQGAEPLVASANGSDTSSFNSLTTQLQQLQTDVSNLTARVDVLEKNTTRGTSTTQVAQGALVKEAVIFMGSGSTISRDWTDIPSAVVTIDPAHYSKIKKISFEAALSIIGGEAHARLVNKTTGAPLFETELFNNTGTSLWKSINVGVMPVGPTQYGVQLKSTSGETAYLNGARIRVVVQ